MLAIALALAVAPRALARSGLGFKAKVTVSGFFHPTLKTVRVLEIAPGSDADLAGLRAGDRIMKIDGRPVAGAPARKTAALIHNARPGQHLLFQVKRGTRLRTVDLRVGASRAAPSTPAPSATASTAGHVGS